MARKSLNQVLGETLTRVMAHRGLSAAALGKQAGVAPNTIGNYMRGGGPEKVTTGDQGKERSADLSKVEKIADALGLNPLELLTDPEQEPTPGQTLGRLFDALPIEGQKRLDLYSKLMAQLVTHQTAAERNVGIDKTGGRYFNPPPAPGAGGSGQAGPGGGEPVGQSRVPSKKDHARP